MNYHYSPALAAAYSVRISWAGRPLDTLNLTTIASASLPKGSKTATCQMPPSSATSEHSLLKGSPEAIREWLMLSRRGSPVSHLPEDQNDYTMPTVETAGQKPFVLLRLLNQNGYIWKIPQNCLPILKNMDVQHTLRKLRQSWPKSGMWDAGGAYQLPVLEQITKESVYGLLPTPVAGDGPSFYVGTYSCAYNRIVEEKKRHQIHWMQYSLLLHALKKGWANPRFSELMMGCPIGWTALKPLAMHRFQQWSKQFGDY